jgi:hypothetical protein
MGEKGFLITMHEFLKDDNAIVVAHGNENKNKNSLIKNFKSNINIDTKMIDNSKDIIIMNDNNEVGNDNIEVKEKNKDEDNIDNYNEKKNNINELNYFLKYN